MNYLILILFLFSFQFGIAQKLTLENTMHLNADVFIGFDNYENLYFIKNKVLYKEGKEGSYQFNSLKSGRISSVDIINPLKIAVFFQETNTVVLLDNKLNEIERFAFHRTGDFFNAASATMAEKNSLWVFNFDSQQLELFDTKSKTRKSVSQPFPGKYLDQASNFNYCFILTDRKLRAFNSYGSLLNEIPAENFEAIVQQNENLVALKNNNVYYIRDFALHKSKIPTEAVPFEIPNPEIRIKDIQLNKNFLSIFDGQNLYIFSLTFSNE